MKKAIILEYKRLDKPPLPKPEKLSFGFDEVVGSIILVGAAILHALWKNRNK